MPRLISYPGNEGIVPNRGINQAKQALSLDDPEWRDAFDAEPLPEGVRRRSGLQYSSDPLTVNLVEENTTGADSIDFTNTTTQYAQSYPGGTKTVAKVIIRIDPSSALGQGTLFCSIHANNVDEPAAAAAANYDESNFNSVAMAGLALAEQAIVFTSDGTGGNLTGTYWIVIRGAATIALTYDDGGNPYATGEMLWDAGAGWVNKGNLDDMRFQVFEPATEEEITGIFDYLMKDGTQRHLIMFTQTLYKNVAAVLTSLGAMATDHGKDVLPSFAQMLERVFVTNGLTGDPSKQFYISSGAEYWENEGIAAPTANAALGNTPAGTNLSVGTWYIDYAYWNSRTLMESNKRYQGDLAQAPSVDIAEGDQLDISTLPGAVARALDAATNKRIYVFGPDTNNKWLYSGVETTLIATTATVSDVDLFGAEASFNHDLPPVHTIKLATSRRQFIAGIEGEPSELAWSRVDGLDLDPDSFPLVNFRQVGVNDEITALFLVPPSTVIIGCKDSIWAIDADNPDIAEELLISDTVGIAGHRAGKVIGRSLFFISDSAKNKGPHWWDGAQVRPLIQLDNFFKDLNDPRSNLISCAHLAPGDARYQWWTLCSASGSTKHNRLVVFDYNLQAFTIYRVEGNVLGEVTVSGKDRMYIGGLNGQEYQADVGSSDLGVPILGEVQLKPFHFGDVSLRKKLRGLVFATNEIPQGSLSLEVEVDYGEVQPITANLNVASATGSLLGTGTYGSFILAGATTVVRREPLRGHGRVFSPKFFGDADWLIGATDWQVQATRRK
jgi:hypothetical protein